MNIIDTEITDHRLSIDHDVDVHIESMNGAYSGEGCLIRVPLTGKDDLTIALLAWESQRALYLRGKSIACNQRERSIIDIYLGQVVGQKELNFEGWRVSKHPTTWCCLESGLVIVIMPSACYCTSRQKRQTTESQNAQ